MRKNPQTGRVRCSGSFGKIPLLFLGPDELGIEDVVFLLTDRIERLLKQKQQVR